MNPMNTQRTFFTSDSHIGHENILKFCPKTRLGEDIYQHNEILIEKWNETVGKYDDVYHLGDFMFGSSLWAETILNRLNGRIHFIWGNHDSLFNSNAKLRQRFHWIGHYKEITLTAPMAYQNVPSDPTKTYVLKSQKVVLFHFPIYEWHHIHRGAFHLYGHVHGSVKLQGRAMDVGIDTRPPDKLMTPWSWEEVYTELINRPIWVPPTSHHVEGK